MVGILSALSIPLTIFSKSRKGYYWEMIRSSVVASAAFVK
jgi:hypothetical protein